MPSRDKILVCYSRKDLKLFQAEHDVSKCSASSRRTCPERSGGGLAQARKGVWGKGRIPFPPSSRWRPSL